MQLRCEEAPCHESNDFRMPGMTRGCCRHAATWVTMGGGQPPYSHGTYLDAPGMGTPLWAYTLSIWCMCPSVTLDPISSLSHSLILASGTLQPLTSRELGTAFTSRLANHNYLKLNHVVDKSQVFVSALGRGIDGRILATSYKHRQAIGKDRHAVRMGTTMLYLIKNSVPAGSGCIAFVPSFGVLKDFERVWTPSDDSKGILDDPNGCGRSLSRIEVIFEKQGGSPAVYEHMQQRYKSAVDSGKRALLIAVYRGTAIGRHFIQ